MADKKKAENLRIDKKEFDLPETIYVRDIENKVVQGIILQCLSEVNGIALLEGNFIDNILGTFEGVKGITAEQDPKSHSISVKVEVKIAYGVSIPEKAEEIQSKIVQELTKLTGLHVSQVHVVFKELILPSENTSSKPAPAPLRHEYEMPQDNASFAEEYSDVF